MEPPVTDRLLATAGRPGGATRLYSSPRSRVWRADLDGRPVIIKQLTEAPDADPRYRRELAGLRRAALPDPPLAPALLGHDPAVRVLILEYLEHTPGPPDWVRFATDLARLHAAGPGTGLPPADRPTGTDVAAFLGLCRALGLDPPGAVRAELAALVDRLAEQPGTGALLHGDPCYGNVLTVAGHTRFVDFEQAAAGGGLAELAYLRIGFPTCGLVELVPQGTLAEAEAAYHATWRAETGTEPPGSLTDECAGWLIRGDALVERAQRGRLDQFARLLTEDWSWGPATASQRLAHRLTVLAGLSAESLDATSRTAAALRDRIVSRWPRAAQLPTDRPEATNG